MGHQSDIELIMLPLSNSLFHSATCSRTVQRLRPQLQWYTSYSLHLAKLMAYSECIMWAAKKAREEQKKTHNECGTHIRLIKFNYNNCRKNNKPKGNDRSEQGSATRCRLKQPRLSVKNAWTRRQYFVIIFATMKYFTEYITNLVNFNGNTTTQTNKYNK